MSHGTQKTKPVEQNSADTLYRHKGFPFMLLAKIRAKIRQPSLRWSFIYARNHSQFYGLLNSDETIQNNANLLVY